MMREKKEKKESDNYIFGTRPVLEAIQNDKALDKVLLLQGAMGEQFMELRAILRDKGIPHQYVPQQKLDSITNGNHQGVVAYLAPITYYQFEQLLPQIIASGKQALVLILDRITDVRNFGAICRTAECCGVDAIVIPTSGAARITEDAIKTSAGALFRIPVCREENLKYALAFAQANGLQAIACTEKSKNVIYDIDYQQATAIIMGSEEDGISPALLKSADRLVAIPMTGKTASLNVSVAAGVILFEAIRQRLA